MFATLLLPHVLVSALLLCVLPCFSALASAQQTFFPPEWPLAVRSPYLSSWEAATKGSQPPYNWPKTSTEAILGWQGLVNIDGVSYNWLGDDLGTGNSTNLTNVLITPTRTVLSMTANTVDFNITFLSPIEASSPNDFVRQSIPFSYIYFEATSRDGNSHSIQVYSDISAEWSSGNRNDQVQWTTTTNNANSVYHSVNLISQTQFEEEFGQAEWGTLYYGIKQGSSITYRTSDASSRNLFRSQGKLDDSQDNKFRAINNSFPVFALSQDLGTIKSTSEPVVWMVGYSRDPAIRYIDLSNVAQDRSLYFQSAYSSLDDVISAFATDFSNAWGRAEQLDARLISAANAISSDYADLLSIAARQVYGATELTIAKGSDGQFNKSDVMMFMRNIGGGDINPVEILYQAFPMFMYLDPTLGAPLLEPLLRFQDSSKYQNPYAAQDVGANYPIAQGDSDGHPQRVEQTANMIIMAAALARTTGDGSLINRYYPLFVKWTDFLSSSTLFLTSESSADLDTTANQTNLAVKGIIAIKAMSDLSSALGHGDDATRYAHLTSPASGIHSRSVLEACRICSAHMVTPAPSRLAIICMRTNGSELISSTLPYMMPKRTSSTSIWDRHNSDFPSTALTL
ncbi:hypothetical protein HETIRDRAFT_480082 [Heterobasidion irregulare TC 32-1]|uniref:DUF1793-domain-containing protein n=1 Tax=Heterobasidion irregulare (strain TC 32-1) TaxID=747525 RepID=W4JX34_HETIT|nr:uncharacterized protein HETIRDRAFT_480082 [Heterobasidion irregulare TC 32-1]ETW77436.1 hypothetical protein HETIRDRAFT_480082 [Heterobasidion irregulare TC 32-1]